MDNASQFFMASFDVENLFTNIPLTETIDWDLFKLTFHRPEIFNHRFAPQNV